MIVVYPRQALMKGIGGRAEIQCVVTVSGALRGCVSLSESPSGYGFGSAAIALTPQFAFRPATRDGKPFESTIKLPVVFPAIPQFASPRIGTRLWALNPRDTTNLTAVSWLTAPTIAQVSSAYPQKARAAHVGGLVTLNCLFGREGRLKDCSVADETPKGYDLGHAARSLANDFVGPATVDSGVTTVGDSTQILVAFSPDLLSVDAPLIGKPQWARLPDAVDMAASFPAAAAVAHVSVGHVVLACDVGPGGQLANCAVEGQTPEGLGFGRAALALVRRIQVSVWTDEGLPTVGGRVSVPIRYEAGVTASDGASAKP